MAETSALFQTIFKAYVDIPQATGEGRLPQVCVKRWLPGMWKFARCAMGGRVCFGPALCAEVSLAEAKLVRESVCARAPLVWAICLVPRCGDQPIWVLFQSVCLFGRHQTAGLPLASFSAWSD